MTLLHFNRIKRFAFLFFQRGKDALSNISSEKRKISIVFISGGYRIASEAFQRSYHAL